MESDLDNNVDAQAAAWFIRLRATNVSRQDQASFLQWLEQSDAHRKAFDEISALWGDADFLKGLTASAKKHGIVPRPDKKRFLRSKVSLALAVCLVLTLAFSGQLRVLIKADYTSALGERKSIHLEDGSVVMLNSDSAVALSMDGAQRWVALLKGEAYFDVKPNPDRPFIVKANHSTTRVLGTHFFVDRQGDSDEVKVLSGRVEVSKNGHWEAPVVLHGGQAVEVATTLGQPKTLDSALSTSWVDGFLVFENETLESVVNQIRRYRTGVILFKDDSLRAMKINGRLSIRQSGDMLKVLQKTLAVKMTYLTDWLVIVG